MRDPGDTKRRKRDFDRSPTDPRDADLDGWGLYPPPDLQQPFGLTRSAGSSQPARPSQKTASSRKPKFSRKSLLSRKLKSSRRAGSSRSVGSSRSTQPAQSARLVQSTRSRPPRGPKWFHSLVSGYRRIPRLVRWPVIAVLALVVLSMLVDAGMYANEIHAGVTIAGLEMSGHTEDEATTALNRFVNEAKDKPITLASTTKTWDVKPYNLGVTIDVAGAVSGAMEVTRKSNVFGDMARKLDLYFNGVDIPLEGTVDSASLDTVIEQVAAELDVPPVDAGLAIQGVTIAVVEGQTGLAVDRDALREQLTQVLLTLHSTEITIPIVVTEPEVQPEDNEEARAQAETMMSAPLTLTSGEQTWTFAPEEIASYLSFTSEDRDGVPTLVPYLSAEKMAAKLTEIAPLVGIAPVESSFDSDGTKAWVVPGTPGTTLDPAKTAEALNAAALKSAGRTAEAVTMAREPELTAEEAEAMGIKDVLSTYSTKYKGGENRQVNVRITTEYAVAGDGVVLAPGEEYNFLDTVGPRTPERGFLKAPGIVPGIKMEDVYGGGICQVSTTLFNAALEAGLKITERKNHTIFILHYPVGRDATATDEGANLRFVNDTGHYIWIRGQSDGIKTTFNIYGTYDGREVNIEVGKAYNVWGPYLTTILDPLLGTGTTVVADYGQKAMMYTATRTITWPDGRTQVDEFVSNYKHRWMVVRVGTGTTTTLPPTTTVTIAP